MRIEIGQEPLTERHPEIKFVRSLEGKLKGHNKGIIDQSENCSFRENMRDLPWALGDVGLPDSLERIYSLRIFLPHLHHFSKTALPNDFEQIEGFDRQRFASDGAEIYFEMEGT